MNPYILENILHYCEADILVTLLSIFPKIIKNEIGHRVSNNIAWKHHFRHIEETKAYEYSSAMFYYSYGYGWTKKIIDPSAYANSYF